MIESTDYKRLLCLAVLSLSALAYAEDAKTDDPLQSIKARAWILMSAETGEILASKEPQLALPMASTTKIMTALLAVRCAEQKNLLKETVKVSKYAAGTIGSSAGLKEGDEVALEDLFYGLLLPSGNDAAVAIAEFIAARMEWPLPKSAHPGEDAFVEQMNALAKELDLKNTHFITPHGIDKKGHQSSAFDLARTMRAALQNEAICKFMGATEHAMHISNPRQDKPRIVALTKPEPPAELNLGSVGVDALKGGSTTAAGSCLVSSAVRALTLGNAPEKKYRLIAAVLNAEPWSPTIKRKGCAREDTAKLYNYGWTKLQNVDGGAPEAGAKPE